MGTKRSLICPTCKYKVYTSGGPDRGRYTHVNTYVCSTCNSLQDLLVEMELPSFKDFINYKPDVNRIKEDESCKECGGKDFKVWDSENKPCPKCGAQLKMDPNGWFTSWD
jgi:NADH pyrophosphatase NudC (nudix superfamily)